MKVEDKTAAKLVQFSKLYPGEVFRTDGQIYMKTDQNKTEHGDIEHGGIYVNAVNLSTGIRCSCSTSLSVEKLNVKLTILPYGTMEEE